MLRCQVISVFITRYSQLLLGTWTGAAPKEDLLCLHPLTYHNQIHLCRRGGVSKIQDQMTVIIT